jgi:osmotically-inducible protein OsmY
MHKPNNLLEFDVNDELEWDPQLDAMRIAVKADDGRVTLTGSVPTLYQVSRATDDAMHVGGTKTVDNQLLVGPVGEMVNDANLDTSTTSALNNDSLVPAGAVTTAVHDGFVTLSGKVRHQYQRQAAEHAVRRVGGVLGVTNNVTLTSQPLPTDVADRITQAFQRSAIIDESKIKVSNDGPTIYLDGIVPSWNARQEAEDTAWAAPGVREVVDRVEVMG